MNGIPKGLIASSGMAQRQSLPLADKIIMSKQRIRQWYDHWDGEVHIAFSGGKDSRVLCDLVWSLYPQVPAIFSNTGLEYPEVVQYVKQMIADGAPITIIRPERTFRDVVMNDGFPLVSKAVSETIQRLRRMEANPSEKNAATRRLYRTGYRKDGGFNANSKLPDKWLPLLDSDIPVTNTCCDSLKKEPFYRYEREHGTKPYVGVMAAEGGARGVLTQCNAFDAKKPQSRPMLFWLEQDVWDYAEQYGIRFAEVYYDRTHPETGEHLPAESRTGCMFCAFGAHLEKGENRFQRMKRSHPKQWNYCVNKLGMGKALDFIGVSYEPEAPNEDQLDLFTDATKGKGDE